MICVPSQDHVKQIHRLGNVSQQLHHALMAPQSSTLSVKGWQTAVWLLITSLQYGWYPIILFLSYFSNIISRHISALNQIQDVLTCKSSAHKTSLSSLLPPCVPMSRFSFAVVTSSFTGQCLVFISFPSLCLTPLNLIPSRRSSWKHRRRLFHETVWSQSVNTYKCLAYSRRVYSHGCLRLCPPLGYRQVRPVDY